MPISRRRSLYGENPEQSQFRGSGTLLVPYTADLGIPLPLPEEWKTPVTGVPNLGYNWEIVNFHIPICVRTSIEKPSTKSEGEMEITLAISVGSQNLFQFRQKVILHAVNPASEAATEAVGNLLFSESPPQSLVIPSGQQLLLSAKATNLSSNVGKSLIEGVVMYYSTEGIVKGVTSTFPQAESSINYRFV